MITLLPPPSPEMVKMLFDEKLSAEYAFNNNQTQENLLKALEANRAYLTAIHRASPSKIRVGMIYAYSKLCPSNGNGRSF